MVKRGLSADPKHREAMGQSVWCFLHIIDRADFETGKVYDWRDSDEAEDMGVNERTLRGWRQNLEKSGYIHCQQKQRGLEITIYNWINPRDYSAGIMNPKGDIKTVPSEFQGDKNPSPSEFQGDMQGDMQGDIRVPEENVTPTYDSRIKNQGSKADADNLAWISKKYTSVIGLIPSAIVADELKEYAGYPLPWLEYAFSQLAEKMAKETVTAKWSYVKKVLQTCSENGGIPTRADKPTGNSKAQSALEFLAGVQ